MRRKDREVKSFDEIIDILSRCKVLHLALISEGKPYSVPLNFGYVLEEDAGAKKLTVYFHCAPEGKKLTAIKENPEVCFSAESLAEADGDKEKPVRGPVIMKASSALEKQKFLQIQMNEQKVWTQLCFIMDLTFLQELKKLLTMQWNLRALK